MKINWKQKLTSRKFWAAVAGLATALLVLFGVDDLTLERVITLIGAEGALIAYIFAEGSVDKASAGADTYITTEEVDADDGNSDNIK